jgi:NADPH:quinone reductase-like Zn-dependent oxidoreductase
MRAVLATGEQQGLIELGEVAEPTPEPHEAVVEVAAFSPNRGETFLLEQPRPGWRPGKDVAGIVTRAAADGSGPTVGERVVGHPDQGGWAERVAVATDRLVAVPDTVDLVAAAALPLAGLTALRLLRVAGSIASRRVLLTGASGGVGHYVVELAAAEGGLVTAVSATAERGERLVELGATDVVTAVEDSTGPFDVGIDSIGGTTTPAVWHQLTQHGTLIWCGQASRKGPQLDFFDWDGATSGTIRRFHYLESDVPVAADLETLVRLVATGRLHPEIGSIEPWQRSADVIDALRHRRIRGNAVLTLAA